MAFWCKFVVEDRIEVVSDLISHPLIYTFNENAPTDFLRKLVIAAEPENKCIPMGTPKKVFEIQINGEFAEKVDPTRETRKPIEFIRLQPIPTKIHQKIRLSILGTESSSQGTHHLKAGKLVLHRQQAFANFLLTFCF